MCSRCLRKSTTPGLVWQYYDDSVDPKVPMHDKCKPCFEEYLVGHSMYLDWPDYVEHGATEAGQHESGEVQSCMRGEPVEFPRTAVDETEGTELLLQKSYLFLNDAEYTKVCKSKPLARHPTTASMNLPKVGGDSERIHLYVDEENPFRRLILQSKLGVEMTTHRLTEEKNYHNTQGANYYSKTLSGQFRADDDVAGLFAGTKHVAHLEDFVNKVRTMEGKGDLPGGAACQGFQDERAVHV